jgi:GNAT superfamily N-acetyltransferase
VSVDAGTVERVRSFWSAWAAVPDDSRAVSVILLGSESFVRASPGVRARVDAAGPLDLHSLVSVLGDEVERAVEARLAYVDDVSFRPVAAEHVIAVLDSDPRIAALAAASNPLEWGEASVDEPCDYRVGVVENDAPAALAAIATVRVWADAIGHLSVFTAAPARRRGLASRVATAVTEQALANGVVPQWRSRVGNDASERVADRLGFAPLGRQLFVRLRASP